MVMFARGKAAAIGVAMVVVLGAMVDPCLAHGQGDNFSCPDIAGINYVRDPEDLHAFYLCVDGLERHHFRCPQVSVLVMGIPPKCVPYPHVRP
jgi:hypothetical protein